MNKYIVVFKFPTQRETGFLSFPEVEANSPKEAIEKCIDAAEYIGVDDIGKAVKVAQVWDCENG